MAIGLEVGDLIYQDARNRGTLLRGPYISTEQADTSVKSVIRESEHNRRKYAKEQELAEIKKQQLIKIKHK